MSEIPKRRSTAHVPHSIRPPRPPACAAHAALRSRNHRVACLPVRLVLGQPPGYTTRGHHVQSNADLVSGFVRQPVEPVVYHDPELALPKAGDVRPTVLERRRLCDNFYVLQVH